MVVLGGRRPTHRSARIDDRSDKPPRPHTRSSAPRRGGDPWVSRLDRRGLDWLDRRGLDWLDQRVVLPAHQRHGTCPRPGRMAPCPRGQPSGTEVGRGDPRRRARGGRGRAAAGGHAGRRRRHRGRAAGARAFGRAVHAGRAERSRTGGQRHRHRCAVHSAAAVSPRDGRTGRLRLPGTRGDLRSRGPDRGAALVHRLGRRVDHRGSAHRPPRRRRHRAGGALRPPGRCSSWWWWPWRGRPARRSG